VATALPEPPLEAEREGLYEVIDGKVVEKPSRGTFECWVAFRLGHLLEAHVETRGLGRTFVETLFRTKRTPSRKRRPDVAFLSAGRWPLDRRIPEGDAFEFAPDLAVEVVSPTDLAVDLDLKIAEYFQAGVGQVWVVYRMTASIVVDESPKLARRYGRGDVLDGGSVLSGFTLAVADLVPEPESEEGQGGPRRPGPPDRFRPAHGDRSQANGTRVVEGGPPKSSA
jgi:Uma2 family endonuclease